MKNLTLISIAIMTFITIGCGHNSTSTDEILVEVETNAPVTDFIDSCRFVILETNDSSIIGSDPKIRLNADYSKIVAYSNLTGFTVFKGDGHWICSFKHQGNGPEEYIDITDFYIQGDEIYAVDCLQSKILVYSINDGQCTRIIPLDNRYAHATRLSDKYIALCAAYYNTSLYNMAILNLENNQIEKRFLPYKHSDSASYSRFTAFVGRTTDGLYVTLPFNTSLYYLTADTCTVAETYHFNTRDQLPPVTMEDIDLMKMEDQTRASRCVKWLGFHREIADDLCYQSFECLTEQGVLPFIFKYNPKTKEGRTLCIRSVVFEEFPYLLWSPIYMDNEYYISAPQAEFVMNHDNMWGETTFSDLGLNYDSNPVIFFHKLKQTW